MYRFKDIQCEIPGERVEDIFFMMNDKDGTVVPHYVLFAIKDEHFEEDLKAAKDNYFDFVRVFDPKTKIAEIEEWTNLS